MTRVAAISDLQLPFVDRDAVAWALEIVTQFRPQAFVMNGDLFDVHGAGPAEGDEAPDADWLDEVEQGAEILRQFRRACVRGADLTLMEGNHCTRIGKPGGRVPRYYRRALDWDRHSSEFSRWRRVPYMKRLEGLHRIGKLVFYHGARTNNVRETMELAEFFPETVNTRGMLFCFGHTHVPEQPARVKWHGKRFPFYHCNTGTFCDPSVMHWTYTRDTSDWAPGVLLAEVNEDEWDARIEVKA